MDIDRFTNLDTITDVNRMLFLRYLDIGQRNSRHHVIKMCETALSVEMTEDKQSRWVGFIQGLLVGEYLLYVDEEREFTRPYFHNVYNKMGLDKPDTVEIEYD